MATALHSALNASEPFSADSAAEAVYRQVLPSVLTLSVENRSGKRFVGTAFLAVREGCAVTAWHLVHDARKVSGQFADGEPVGIAGVVDRDERKDIALLRVDSTNRPMTRLCLAPPSAGTRVYTIGAPRGYDFTVSEGLVGRVGVVDGFVQYQVSCPISPGNSGGPVLNPLGEIVGVVCWSEKDAQNLNFATPAHAIGQLRAEQPLLAWSGLPKSSGASGFRLRERVQRDAWFPRAGNPDPEALRRALRENTGRPATVILTTPNGEEIFDLRALPDLSPKPR